MGNQTFSFGPKTTLEMMGKIDTSITTEELVAINTIQTLHGNVSLKRDPKVVSDYVLPLIKKLGFTIEQIKTGADGDKMEDVYRHNKDITVWTFTHTGSNSIDDTVKIQTVEDVAEHFALACEKLQDKLTQSGQHEVVVKAQIDAIKNIPDGKEAVLFQMMQSARALDKEKETEPTKMYLVIDTQLQDWGLRTVSKETARSTAMKWIGSKVPSNGSPTE